eukprot:GHVU01204648.1.p1 GENE.GHVU01204648.1~~GHVU01204648.1.p1  ORF type:complete len:488 (+),score=69.16 GHVU01204648.1:203-1666(+)
MEQTAVTELCEFIAAGRKDVRIGALEIAAGLSSNEEFLSMIKVVSKAQRSEGVETDTGRLNPVRSICRCIGGAENESRFAVTALVNMSEDEELCEAMVASSVVSAAFDNLKDQLRNDAARHEELNLMLLANVTRIPSGCDAFISRGGAPYTKRLTIILSQSPCPSQDRQYPDRYLWAIHIVANVTTNMRGRKLFDAWDFEIISSNLAVEARRPLVLQSLLHMCSEPAALARTLFGDDGGSAAGRGKALMDADGGNVRDTPPDRSQEREADKKTEENIASNSLKSKSSATNFVSHLLKTVRLCHHGSDRPVLSSDAEALPRDPPPPAGTASQSAPEHAITAGAWGNKNRERASGGVDKDTNTGLGSIKGASLTATEDERDSLIRVIRSLCHTPTGRELLRVGGCYEALRDFHLEEPSEKIRERIEDMVHLLHYSEEELRSQDAELLARRTAVKESANCPGDTACAVGVQTFLESNQDCEPHREASGPV